MDLTPYTQNLRDDLLTAASVGDEDSRRAAALLASAIEPAARLAIMNALSDLAAEVTGALAGHHRRAAAGRPRRPGLGCPAPGRRRRRPGPHDGYFRKRTDDGLAGEPE